MQRVEDAISCMRPGMAEKLAPAKFVHQLVIDCQRLATQHFGRHLAQRHQAMSQVGRKAGHRTGDVVTRARILCGSHPCCSRDRRTPGGW